jgi:hypothetical protein
VAKHRLFSAGVDGGFIGAIVAKAIRVWPWDLHSKRSHNFKRGKRVIQLCFPVLRQNRINGRLISESRTVGVILTESQNTSRTPCTSCHLFTTTPTVRVFNLSTVPLRHVGKWRYSCTHSYPSATVRLVTHMFLSLYPWEKRHGNSLGVVWLGMWAYLNALENKRCFAPACNQALMPWPSILLLNH